MYHHIQDFLADWKLAAENTAKIFANITEETKAEKIAPNIRTLERLAWHITQTITEMGSRAGIFDHNALEDQPIPATFSEIAATHARYNALLADAVYSRWTDASLTDRVQMYTEEWTKGVVLSVLVSHEAHHRSQMTIIMRMLGLMVPGLYGPSAEEWAAYGMPAMA